MADFQHQRRRMVETQIAARGIRDAQVLDAMRTVPREHFLSDGMQEFAYEDAALPIAEEQTISQPYVVALMLEAAEIGPGDNVLDVGAGPGYAAALISRIASQVQRGRGSKLWAMATSICTWGMAPEAGSTPLPSTRSWWQPGARRYPTP